MNLKGLGQHPFKKKKTRTTLININNNNYYNKNYN
jgi:hypothetical protein